ncbi:MAG TPA: prealbumin-like fold domain-containing protein [Gaiellaceae bacterium]|nr:prealbumin-like fold domain-containing protein [Gaiellaceae bacterium]
MARKVIGPTGSRRRRWLFLCTTLAALAVAAFFIAGAGAVNGSPSGFESGELGTGGANMVLDNLDGSHTDWNCFVGSSGFQSGTPDADCAVTSGATQFTADSTPAGELEFKGGTKFDTPCPVIQGGNNPPKDEWSNIAEYIEASPNLNSDNGHDLYFYGASIRPVVNGNSSGNVYFSQSSNGCRTVGDVLLTFDFLQGGGAPTLHSLRWLGSGSCYVSQDSAPCWGDQQTINGANFDGNINTSQIDGTANGISGTTLPANAFSEFGINLTQAIKAAGGGSLPCFASQTWVSRSSGSSFTSQPEDVEVISKPTCGTITVIKHTQNGAGTRPTPGIDQSFNYSTTGGLTPATFSLNDKDGTDTVNGNPDPNNTRVYSNVPAGSYSVTEGTLPANFAFVSLSCSSQGTGTSTDTTTTPGTAAITLGFSGNVVCTYTNKQQLGAIRINKTSSKSPNGALAGAKFYICTNSSPTTSNCTAPTPVGGSALAEPQTTDANGQICVANLPFAHYYVFESNAPSGYAIDDSTVHDANVNGNGDCSSSTSATVTLNPTDTPLSKIYLGWHSLAGVGVTTATVQCTGENSASTFTDGGATPTITKTLGNGSTTLTPGTYTCTVIIDP